jgi:acyl dehydratase
VTSRVTVGGPYFDDLAVGQVFAGAPSVTLTDGLAALHRAIVGDRLRVPLDATLAAAVVGHGPVAHPALVCDVAIGQSTVVTGRVVANVFYGGLLLRRPCRLGDTLQTTTEVVALRQNRPKPRRHATGLAALRIRTVDQVGRLVLDFWRCAMLPLRDPGAQTGHADTFDAIPESLGSAGLREAAMGWNVAAFRASLPDHEPVPLTEGTVWVIESGDVVSAAPELARLTLNNARTHHDRRAGRDDRRLVYGGHTVGLAAAQAVRALPDLVTILGWHGCDHLGPVFEDDTLDSELELESLEPLPSGGTLLHLHSRVRAHRASNAVDVLSWRFVALAA